MTREWQSTALSYNYNHARALREREALVSRERSCRRRLAVHRRSAVNRRLAALLLALVAWACVGYVAGFVRVVALKRDIARVERELQATLRQNRELEKMVAEMQKPEYIERMAREKLGLMRPDEVRFMVGRPVDPGDPQRRDVVKRPGTGEIYN
ncbi:MAG TPA: septum formation initiator family protein [Firmicutes bacterium]|nr:septum formation initiator family protein [Bacillota bacterium]